MTSGNDAEILQIAATDSKDEFSIYVKPCHVISPEASAVNKLTFERGMLFYHVKPITDAIAIDVALKNFIEWLKSRMPCILVAHNIVNPLMPGSWCKQQRKMESWMT